MVWRGFSTSRFLLLHNGYIYKYAVCYCACILNLDLFPRTVFAYLGVKLVREATSKVGQLC